MRPPISQHAEQAFLQELHSLARLMGAHADRVKAAGAEWHEHEKAAQAGIRLSLEQPGAGGDRATVAATMHLHDCQMELWVGIDGFLSAWGRASLILWPAPHLRSSDEHKARASARGGYLCEVLGIDDDHPLNDRGLRNAWIHFDERVDDAYHEHGRGIKLQQFRQADEDDGGVVMRDFDLTNLAVTVEGVRHDLEDLFAAAERLGEKVLEAAGTLPTRRYADPEGEDPAGATDP